MKPRVLRWHGPVEETGCATALCTEVRNAIASARSSSGGGGGGSSHGGGGKNGPSGADTDAAVETAIRGIIRRQGEALLKRPNHVSLNPKIHEA